MGNQIEVVVVLEDIRICKNAAVTRRLCNNLREKTCECKCYLIFFFLLVSYWACFFVGSAAAAVCLKGEIFSLLPSKLIPLKLA